MGDILVGIILVIVLGLALYKVIKDKKNGKTCSGCNVCSDVKKKCK